MDGFSIFVLVILVVAIATVFAGVKTVPQGYHYTVERFRRYTTTMTSGLMGAPVVVARGKGESGNAVAAAAANLALSFEAIPGRRS